MGTKTKEKKGVFDSFGYTLPEDLKCIQCGKVCKSEAGYKSHFLNKHTDYKQNRLKRNDKAMQQRLADLTIEKVKQGLPLNDKQLLELAGYTQATIAKSTKRAFSTKGFQDALANRGITMESIVSVLEEASRAEQGSWYQGTFYKDESPDHQTRLKAVKELGDLLGVKKRIVEQRSVNVNLSGEDIRGMIGLD